MPYRESHSAGCRKPRSVGDAIDELVCAGVAGRGCVQHLPVLDGRRAVRRRAHGGKRQTRAAIGRQHVDLDRGAGHGLCRHVGRNGPANAGAADVGDRHRSRVGAKGHERDVERKRRIARQRAGLDRHHVRPGRQVDLAIGPQAADGHALRQKHSPVCLDVQQIVGTGQARRTHDRRATRAVQRYLERVGRAACILEQLSLYGKRQCRLRATQQESLAEGGQHRPVLSECCVTRREANGAGGVPGIAGGGRVRDSEAAIAERAIDWRRGVQRHTGRDDCVMVAKAQASTGHDGCHRGRGCRLQVAGRRQDPHALVQRDSQQRTWHRAVRQVIEAEGVAVFVLQHRQQVEVLRGRAAGDGQERVVGPGRVGAAVTRVPAHAGARRIDGDSAVAVTADLSVGQQPHIDLHGGEPGRRVRHEAARDPVVACLSRHARDGVEREIRRGRARRGHDAELLGRRGGIFVGIGLGGKAHVLQQEERAEAFAQDRGRVRHVEDGIRRGD